MSWTAIVEKTNVTDLGDVRTAACYKRASEVSLKESMPTSANSTTRDEDRQGLQLLHKQEYPITLLTDTRCSKCDKYDNKLCRKSVWLWRNNIQCITGHHQSDTLMFILYSILMDTDDYQYDLHIMFVKLF